MNDREFVASVFKKFNLNMKTLPSRIAFQKTIFIMQEFGSGTSFNFRWHNFGPYSSGLADLGFNLSIDEIDNSSLNENDAVIRFVKLTNENVSDTKLLEMLADIIYLKKYRLVKDDKELFNKIKEHRPYLEDWNMFKECLKRLSEVNASKQGI